MDSMQLKNTMLYLKKHHFDPYFVNTKEDVLPLIEELVPMGAVVANGGSETLKECGVLEFLQQGNYEFVNCGEAKDPESLRQRCIQAYGSDVFFCSSNAVTEDGYLYNVDGNSNRIACIAYGPKQVIMVVGRNKLVKDLDEAVRRVKTVCAPAICSNRGNATYCADKKECVSLQRDAAALCDGCDSPDRVCCNYLISGQQRHKNRIKIIIVDEVLGY